MPDSRRLGWVLCLLCFAMPALAQERSGVQADLDQTMQALESAAKERKALEKRNEKLQEELSALQQDLVDITTRVQTQEKLLTSLEANLLNLQDEERAKADHLLRRRAEQAQMVQTMLRLSRVPPAMVVAMPGDFDTTLRTAKVLGLTTTALTEQAEQITHELAEIHALQSAIRQNHAEISKQKQHLQRDETRLQAKLETREEIQGKLLSRYEAQQQEVQRLSDASGNLRELMSQLEERHKETTETLAVVPEFKPETDPPSKQGKKELPAKFAAAQGKISLPAEGKIFIFYGDTNEDGDDSRGISIRTRTGAKVTSPYPGEVAYTGTFLDYGNMVILRHDDGYHSLLAGMEQVSAKLGQKVIKGEPVGEMGRNEDKTALYMEIRKDNRPIDPMPWLEQSQHYATKRQLLR